MAPIYRLVERCCLTPPAIAVSGGSHVTAASLDMTENTDSDGDAELGDFDHFEQAAKDPEGEDPLPVKDPDADPEPEQVNVPMQRISRSEFDRNIRPGDVVRDLWGQAWVIAVERKADSVREYDAAQPDTKQSLLEYEGSIGMGATEDDAVWACFYINTNNTLAGGRSGPYDFPESRICRYAYEATDGYKQGRFQDRIQNQAFEALLQTAIISGELDEDQVRLAISQTFGVDRADEAMELAEASVADLDSVTIDG